jgi:zinc protease
MRIVGLLLCLASCATADVRLPKYTRQQLPNGTVIYLVPRPGVPLVNFRIAVKGGFEAEAANEPGVAQLTAQLLRRGTATRSADQFSVELDSLGGSFNATANEEETLILSEFLKKDFDAGLALTADAVLHPTFPESEFRKTLSRSLDGLRSIKDNPQGAMPLYFRAFFFGPNHPYGRVADEVTLATLTRASLSAYQSRLYTGKNLIVVAGGDIDPATAGPALARAFGGAPAGTEYKWTAEAPLPTGRRLLLIDKPDATQTYFNIGQPGLRRSDPDRTVVLLVNTIFGGRFTSMLNDELRVNTGLTYGARSYYDQHRDLGGTVISTYTRTETTERAMDSALELLNRLVAKGLTADQLASAKAYVKGTYPPQHLETSDQTAAMISDIELFGLNRGEVDDLFSRIDSITLEQANAIARKYYGGKDLTFVVIGNASKIRDPLKKYAPEFREVPIKAPGFTLQK